MSLVDITPLPAEDELMDPAAKQYVDSGLVLAEAQSDAKFAEHRAVIEKYIARADERQARADERHAASEARFERIETRLDRIEASIASLKKFVVGASLSTVLGVAAFDAALIQNYHAAFDSSRYLSVAEQDMAAQRKRTEALLSAMEAQLAGMQKMNGQKASPP
jgi:hypothetical protein